MTIALAACGAAQTEQVRTQPQPPLTLSPTTPVEPFATTSASATAPALPPGPFEPLSRGRGPADALLVDGDRAFANDDTVGAESAYQKAAEKDPKSAAAWTGLARTSIAQSEGPTELNAGTTTLPPRITLAIEHARKAVSLDGLFAPAHVELGRALLIAGKTQEALAELELAKEQGATSAEASSALGVALMGVGRGDDAIGPLARAVKLDPKNATRHRLLGAVLASRGRVEEAVTELQVAANLAPDDARTASDLGGVYLAAGTVDLAITSLERALKLEPKRTGALINLAYAKLLKGDLDGSIAASREALKNDPKRSTAWINLGVALTKKKQYAEARKAFEQALTLDPDDPRAKENLEGLKKEEAAAKTPPAKPGKPGKP